MLVPYGLTVVRVLSGAIDPASIFGDLVQVVVRCRPREPTLRIVDVPVQGGDRGVAQQAHPGILPSSGRIRATPDPLLSTEGADHHTVPMVLRRKGVR